MSLYSIPTPFSNVIHLHVPVISPTSQGQGTASLDKELFPESVFSLSDMLELGLDKPVHGQQEREG